MRGCFTAVCVLLAGCDDNLFGESVVEDVEPPSQDGYLGVQEIVGDSCLGCHSTASQLGGLDLETDLHLATVGVLGAYGVIIVNPGDPATSLLYLKVTNTQPDGTAGDMPPGTGGLGLVLTDVIEQWILDGATTE